MSFDFLVIEGNIGAGKTTLAGMLSRDQDAKLILERFADNPFLPKFYEDPGKYSFPLELSFLAERYNQMKNDLANRDLFQQQTISDYYFMKSLIFAQNTLAIDEYNLYRNFFEIIYERLPRPDLYVYFHLPESRLIEQIKKRGRSYEQAITADYLRSIREGYFNYFAQQSDFPILVIDGSAIDFVANESDYQRLREVIYSPVDWTGIRRVIL